MTQFVLDLFFSTVFIVLLILLYKAKDRIFARNSTCYHYTHGGLLALCIVALIQTAGHQGLLHGIPFLSEEVYRNLIEAIGIVTGVTLMIAGASFWLPGNRKTAELNTEICRSEIPSDIHDSILTSNEPSDIFKKTVEKICRQYHFSGFAIYRYSAVNREFLCTDCNHLPHAKTMELKQVTIDPDQPEEDFARLKQEFDFSCYLPISVGNRLGSAIFFSRDRGMEITEEESSQLAHIAKSISSRLTRKYHSAKNEFYESCWINLRRLTRLNNHRGGLRDHLGGIYDIFKEAVGTEYICMAIFDESRRHFRRYSIGINGNVLLDTAVMPDLDSSHFGTILRSGQTLIIDDIDLAEDTPIDSLFLSCAQKSLMAIPVFHGGRITAIVTLGSPTAAAFNRRNQYIARLLCYTLKPSFAFESSHLHRVKALTHMDRLYSFNRILQSDRNLSEIFEHTAEHIMGSIETTLVRIHRVSPDQTSLIGAVTNLCRPVELEDRDGFPLDREITPSYCAAVYDNEIAVVTKDNADIDRAAAEFDAADLHGMKSAVVMPVVANGMTIAVITIADMRRDARAAIDTGDLTYLGCVAETVSMNLRIVNLGRLMASVKMDDTRQEGPRKLKINLKGLPENTPEDIPVLSEIDRKPNYLSEITVDRETFRESIEESRRNIAELVETGGNQDI